jgi:hypothetical protein
MYENLKKALTKLTLKVGNDCMSLLPYALYKTRNIPNTFGLASFETLYGKHPPMLLKLQSDILNNYNQYKILESLISLYMIQKQLWSKIHHFYNYAPLPNSHFFELTMRSRLRDLTTKLLSTTVLLILLMGMGTGAMCLIKVDQTLQVLNL